MGKSMKWFSYSIGAIFLLVAQFAHAVPLLQFFIEGGTYDAASESWVTDQSSFDIWVIGNTGGAESKGVLHDVTLVAAVTGGDLADLTITPMTTSLVDDPSVPVNPISANSGTGEHPIIPPHGIYTTGTDWEDFLLGDMGLTDSPLGDAVSGGFPLYEAGQTNSAQINAYHVEMTGDYEQLHFDAFGYYEKRGELKQVIAPFSHDAVSIVAISSPQTAVLLLVGVIGIWGCSRKRA